MIHRTVENVVEVLRQLEYVVDESLTVSGRNLTRIFAERDLLVSEVIRRGIFNDLTAEEIPAVLSGLLYESRSEDRQLPRIPRNFVSRVQEIARIWGVLAELESKFGLETQREPDFAMSWSIYRWSSGSALSRILRESDITAGDFVRHVKQIIDLLGQMVEADQGNAEKYMVSLSKIDRGLVKIAAVV